jgi:hypothetical protein
MLSYRDFCHVFDGVKVYEDEFLPPAVNEGTTASKIRCRRLPQSRGGQRIVKKGGWHFTCLGGVEAVAKKIASFAHQEYNPGEGKVSLAALEKMIREGKGPFWEMRCFAESIDESYPRYIQDGQHDYSNLIYPVDQCYLRRVRFPRLIHTVRGKLIGVCERTVPTSVGNILHRLKLRMRARTPSRRGRSGSET